MRNPYRDSYRDSLYGYLNILLTGGGFILLSEHILMFCNLLMGGFHELSKAVMQGKLLSARLNLFYSWVCVLVETERSL